MNQETQPKPFRHFNEVLKDAGYPFAWYVQREPRKLIIGPKGFNSEPNNFYELGPVTCGVGYEIQTQNFPPDAQGVGTPGKSTYYALASEGISLAAKLGLKFTFSEVENKIPNLK